MSHLNQVLLHPNSRVGVDLECWLAGIGGIGLELALAAPEAIIPLIEAADLRGLGGSGYPTYLKWRFVAQESRGGDRYLICNGNEDEPGTFKDRLLLEQTPFQILEGATIAALATRINRIILYINPEMEQQLGIMAEAIKQWSATLLVARCSAYLGQTLRFDLLPSSGHYVGGEETAAIETVEGNFPFPRGKPPFPAQRGVHGCPTLINNMETLANVSHILRMGAKWFQQLGHGAATGTKLYCLSGDVVRPGVYELPMGTTLDELIHQHGGGMLLNKSIKAIFTGGPSNTLLTPGDLQVALDFESVKERGSSLGTGAMIVISEGTGIVKRVAEYVSFFAHSSCGQCPPCKTGTHQASQLLYRIDTGQGDRSDLDTLIHMCEFLPGSGRCHLINGAMTLISSALDHFMPEFEQALRTRISPCNVVIP